MVKEANLLLFRFSLKALNDILFQFIEGVSILPRDLHVFKMGALPDHLDGYWLMMSSNVFPLVKEGDKVEEGEVEFITSDYGNQMTFGRYLGKPIVKGEMDTLHG